MLNQLNHYHQGDDDTYGVCEVQVLREASEFVRTVDDENNIGPCQTQISSDSDEKDDSLTMSLVVKHQVEPYICDLFDFNIF